MKEKTVCEQVGQDIAKIENGVEISGILGSVCGVCSDGGDEFRIGDSNVGIPESWREGKQSSSED